jgi:hypothetical protein
MPLACKFDLGWLLRSWLVDQICNTSI